MGLDWRALDEQQFKDRAKKLAIRTTRLAEAVPPGRAADIIGRQLMRSATSVGANYRAGCRARSTAEMIAKLGIVEEEAGETPYWLELLGESGLMSKERLQDLIEETDEIVAMTVVSIKTLRAGLKGAPTTYYP